MTTTIAGVVFTKDFERIPIEAAFERGRHGYTWLIAARSQADIPKLGIRRGDPVLNELADLSIDLLSEWAHEYPWHRLPAQVVP